MARMAVCPGLVLADQVGPIIGLKGQTHAETSHLLALAACASGGLEKVNLFWVLLR